VLEQDCWHRRNDILSISSPRGILRIFRRRSILFMPHHQQAVHTCSLLLDVTHSAVGVSVCLCVGHRAELSNNGRTDRDVICLADSCVNTEYFCRQKSRDTFDEDTYPAQVHSKLFTFYALCLMPLANIPAMHMKH